MPRIAYERINFSEDSRLVIQQANAIIAEYIREGFRLTLRQLYYQFVARGLLANNDKNYKRLGGIVNDARMAGKIDWEAIEDRTRYLRDINSWDHPGDILDACAEQFKFDLWEGQEWRPEVWIEKDALVGVIEPICRKLRVPFFACRGYNSQSNQWGAGQRIKERYEGQDQKTLVLHLGDHDPSGIDMTRDNDDRLRVFAEHEDCFEMRRLALNMDQVKRFNPPPNPAKLSDSRARGYIQEHGDESWELDALEPRVISKLIQDNVESVMDDEKWEAATNREIAARAHLKVVAEKARKKWNKDDPGSDKDEE